MTDEPPNTTAPEPPTSTPTAAPASSDAPTAPSAPQVAGPGRAVSSAETRPRRPDYRGEELDPERGPGLGCFWFQVIVLGFFIVLIPIGLELNWPFELLALLLFVVIGLLLLTGQSVIFLLRLVAADRRTQGRRRPLASSTKTVGELEDAQEVADAVDVTDAPVELGVATAAGTDEPVESDRAHDSQAMIRDHGIVEGPPAGAGDPEPALADPSHDAESMIRGAGVVETPRTEADTVGLAAGPVADVDAAGIGAGDEAPARTDAGRTHESSPESHEVGAPRTEDADTDPDTVAGAAAPVAVVGTAAPDEASPEEPGAGVRQ